MILLDTHVLLWWATQQPERLSDIAHQALEHELKSGQIVISSISAWDTRC
jgi:PIN domain nuclease of toxin-antitoxin system